MPEQLKDSTVGHTECTDHCLWSREGQLVKRESWWMKWRKNNLVKFVLLGSKDNTCRIWQWLKKKAVGEKFASNGDQSPGASQRASKLFWYFKFSLFPQASNLYTVLSITDMTIKTHKVLLLLILFGGNDRKEHNVWQMSLVISILFLFFVVLQ